MRVRKLDENGDIVTSGIIWNEGQYTIAQTIKTRLKLFLGEYFRDISEGVPWFEKPDGSYGILQKGYSLEQVEALLRSTISQTDGVLTILSFSSEFDENQRRLTIRTIVATQYGNVEVSNGFSI